MDFKNNVEKERVKYEINDIFERILIIISQFENHYKTLKQHPTVKRFSPLKNKSAISTNEQCRLKKYYIQSVPEFKSKIIFIAEDAKSELMQHIIYDQILKIDKRINPYIKKIAHLVRSLFQGIVVAISLLTRFDKKQPPDFLFNVNSEKQMLKWVFQRTKTPIVTTL